MFWDTFERADISHSLESILPDYGIDFRGLLSGWNVKEGKSRGSFRIPFLERKKANFYKVRTATRAQTMM